VLAQKPAMVYEWIGRGMLMQMNAGSLTGRFGKGAQKMAELMLAQNWTHFIASDAHSARSRPPGLSEAYALVEKKYGRQRSENLFLVHPLSAVEGRAIDIEAPLPLKKKRGLKTLFSSAR